VSNAADRCVYNVLSVVLWVYLQQQDHYAVLGLAKLRYRATEDQIKRACELVLMHLVLFVGLCHC